MIREMQSFLEWVGAGRSLTPGGELHKADAIALVRLLGTKDEVSAPGGDVRRIRSSRDLPVVQDVLERAKEARIVRVVRGRLLPVKKNAPLFTSVDGVLRLLLEALERSWNEGFRLSDVSRQTSNAALRGLWQALEVAQGPVHAEELAAQARGVVIEHESERLLQSDLEWATEGVRGYVDYYLWTCAFLGLLWLDTVAEVVGLTEQGRAECRRVLAAPSLSDVHAMLSAGVDRVDDVSR